MIGAGGTKLALFRAAAGASGEGRGESPSSLRWHRVAWRTGRDGFLAAQKHLREHDVAFRGPVDHGVAQSVYFQDPDGHPLEITWYSEEP
jgi:catechol-2,3-dioxygenase